MHHFVPCINLYLSIIHFVNVVPRTCHVIVFSRPTTITAHHSLSLLVLAQDAPVSQILPNMHRWFPSGLSSRTRLGTGLL